MAENEVVLIAALCGPLVVVAMFRPYWGLILMVLAGSLRRFVAVPGIGEVGTLIGIFTLVGVIMEVAKRRSLIGLGLKSRLWWPIFTFVAVAGASVVAGVHFEGALGQWFRMATRFVPFFFVLTSQLRSYQRLRGFCWAVVAVGFYWTFESMARLAYFEGGLGKSSSLSFSSGRGAPESLAMLAIPMAMALLWEERRRVRRLFLHGVVFMFALGIAFSCARAALVALIALAAFLGAKRYRFRIKAWVGLFLVGAAIWALTPDFVTEQRIRPVMERGAQHRTVGTRFNMWYAGMKVIQDYPVLGVGIGNSALVVPSYASIYHLKGTPYSGSAKYVHNAYLDVGVQMGLLGMAAFIWMLVAAFRSLEEAARLAKRWRITRLQNFAIGLQAAFVAFAVSGMFGKAWDGEGLWYLFGVSAAFLKLVQAQYAQPGRQASVRGYSPAQGYAHAFRDDR